MSYYVYILHSQSTDNYYTGFSKYRGKRRRQHGHKHNHWTSRAKDWQEVHCERAMTVEEARVLEKRIKSRGAKRYLDDLRD